MRMRIRPFSPLDIPGGNFILITRWIETGSESDRYVGREYRAMVRELEDCPVLLQTGHQPFYDSNGHTP